MSLWWNQWWWNHGLIDIDLVVVEVQPDEELLTTVQTNHWESPEEQPPTAVQEASPIPPDEQPPTVVQQMPHVQPASLATIQTIPYNMTAILPSASEIEPFGWNHNKHKKEERWWLFWKTI